MFVCLEATIRIIQHSSLHKAHGMFAFRPSPFQGITHFAMVNIKKFCFYLYLHNAIVRYLANSMARVSRMTLTLMVPGYCMVLSILVAISRASLIADRSSISLGRTNTRTSRPALMA